ncbi:hypothetical protein GGR77_000268 [Xanthomonas translucens]
MVKNPGAAVAAPGFNAQSQNAPSPPSDRRRRGGAQVALCAINPRSPSVRPRTAPTTFRTRPAAMGRACGATPRLAATGCTNACRPRRWQFVACTSLRAAHRHTDRPCNEASTPRLTQEAAFYVRALSTSGALSHCRWALSLPVSGYRPVKPLCGDAESAMSPFGSGRPVRPCVVVNPGGGWASWPQPSSENNSPCAARIPRGTNSFRFQVLHVLRPLRGAASPSPAGRITTRTHWRDLVQPERRNHHG